MRVPDAVYGYGMLYLIVGIAGYAIYKKFLGPNFDKVSEELDKFATSSGEQTSQATYGAYGLYTQARSDYQKSIAWDVKRGDAPNWPTEDNWEHNGAGPSGYKYGDPKYPRIQPQGILSTAFSWLAVGSD